MNLIDFLMELQIIKYHQNYVLYFTICDIQELNTFKLFHDHKNNLNEDFIYRQTN